MMNTCQGSTGRQTAGSPTGPEYCHERLSPSFETIISMYDTKQRVDVLVHKFLRDDMIRGKEILDVGCGLGFFSEALNKRGGIVTACDISPALVQRTRERVGCRCEVADALNLVGFSGTNRFDVVVSSECIEHTRNPSEAVIQMVRVLKPGVYLSLSTPNLPWQPLVRAASALRLRPYDGYENFSSWEGLRTLLKGNGMAIEAERGMHILPFQLRCHGLLSWCDRHLQSMKKLMINICILARKA